MQTNESQHFSVLLEHEDGVMEVFFSLLQNGKKVTFRPMGSVPCSGSIRSTDREILAEALRLSQWSQDHAEVFEGRVVKQATQA